MPALWRQEHVPLQSGCSCSELIHLVLGKNHQPRITTKSAAWPEQGNVSSHSGQGREHLASGQEQLPPALPALKPVRFRVSIQGIVLYTAAAAAWVKLPP